MINANELRLNNEVFYDGDTMCSIVGINWGSTVELAGCDGFISVTDIDPIPLTPKIIEECGFVWKDGCAIKGNLSIKNTPPEYQVYGREQALIEIKYLHQLQNLYFALTGEELEINL